MPAPPANCGIIAGSAAKLFICSDEDPSASTVTNLTWVEVMDLNEFTITMDSTDTDLNTAGWIRSLPMERGMSITATGRVNATDPGQQLVEERSLNVGCDALSFYRLLIPGPSEGDPPYKDIGFWSWASMQDISAASTDPFSWGVELRLWSKPIDLEDGQVPASASVPGSASPQATRTTPRQPAGAGAGGGASALESETRAA